MKIAVYTIAKNEEQFVERWAESCKEADYRIILDTGSTDRTVELARSIGVTVEVKEVKPWRFDHARNAALDAVPEDADYCIALDMDEVLQPGWRNAMEKATATRPRYEYTWSWEDEEEGIPGLVYGGDKIHARHGYFWHHPVHEILSFREYETQEWIDLKIHHHPDNTKSRGQYFPLLELAVEEDPEDDRNAHYLAREYYFHGIYDKAVAEFKRHLSLPRAVWRPERAASMRYLSKCDIPLEKESWLLRAAGEAPDRREGWVELSVYYYEQGMWPLCYAAATRALKIVDKPLEYICEAQAWGSVPHDMAAISAFRLGLYKEAFMHAVTALSFAPDDLRLQNNLEFCKKALEEAQEDE